MKTEQNTVCSVCGEEKGWQQQFGWSIPKKCRCEKESEAKQKEAERRKAEKCVRLKMTENSGLKPIACYPEKLSAIEPVPGQEAAHRACMAFCREFMEKHRFEGMRGIALAGTVGGGKTYFAGALVRSVIGLCPLTEDDITYAVHFGTSNSGRTPVRFVNSAELFSQIRDYGSATGRDMLYECKNAPLLILDDLGAELKNKATAESLYTLLDYRMNGRLPIVITVNLSPDEMRKEYGDRIYDRIKAMCDIVGVTAKSQRGAAT